MLAQVETVLEYLGDYRIFEKGAAKGMRGYLPRVFDADQIAGESNIVEIELWGLDQTLPKVGVKRVDEENDVAGLQKREPATRRRMGDPGVRAQGGEIEQLADSSCAEADETSKGR